MAPESPPTSSMNEFTAPHAGSGQYVQPSESIPAEYWQQVAASKVAANSGTTSTVACWLCVLLGLILPIFALGAGLWAVWLARDDSRFTAPAVVGLGIFALAFLV